MKIVGQELVDRADKLIPDTEGVKDIDIFIRIPSLSNDPSNIPGIIPDIQVNTNVYPNQGLVEKIIKLIAER